MIASFIVDIICVLSKNTRKVIERNLTTIKGSCLSLEEKKRLTKRAFLFQLYNIVEYIFLLFGLYSLFQIKIRGYKYYKKLRNSDENTSLLCGHFGNWELLGCWLGMNNIPIYSIVLEARLAVVEWIFQTIRKMHGIGTIDRRDRMELFRTVMDPSKVVAFLSDQDGEASGYWVKFFGKYVSFPSGASSFASRGKGCFVPVYMQRKGFMRHEIIFEKPFKIESKGREEIKREFVKKTLAFYERRISECPENWLLIYDRWKFRRHYPICEKNKI